MKFFIIFFITISATFAQEAIYEQPSDSVEIYKNMIFEENIEANYTSNIVGSFMGGVLIGGGVFFFSFGIYAICSNTNPDTFDEGAGRIVGGMSIFASSIFFSIGVPVFIHNMRYYRNRKNHANKRDEYQNALDRYKLQRQQKKSSIKVIMFPSFDFENHGGKIYTTILF